jgi:hypothetical protein
MRPIRLYRHTFGRQDARLEVVRSGCTPCQARAAAFRALEQQLVKDQLPKQGWRLLGQVDVTHLVTQW